MTTEQMDMLDGGPQRAYGHCSACGATLRLFISRGADRSWWSHDHHGGHSSEDSHIGPFAKVEVVSDDGVLREPLTRAQTTMRREMEAAKSGITPGDRHVPGVAKLDQVLGGMGIPDMRDPVSALALLVIEQYDDGGTLQLSMAQWSHVQRLVESGVRAGMEQAP